MAYLLNSDKLEFPHPSLADEDGLLAIGGDLSANRLLLAYQYGIFPWYTEGLPIMWYSPHERFVLYPEKLKISKSFRKLIEKHDYNISRNRRFSEVIRQCASIPRKGQEGTWITNDIVQAYTQLHLLGLADSIEISDKNDQLIGGLYGVRIGNIFCGESMFSLKPNTSKLALHQLCQDKSIKMIDCQIYTRHLASMGAEHIYQDDFMKALKTQIHFNLTNDKI